MNPDRSARPLAAVAALLAFACAVLCARIVQYSRNTLLENGRWVASKVLMGVPPTGAREFVATRPALAQNRLRLGAWHGFQEVHLNRAFVPGRLSAQFRLGDDAYVVVFFHRNASGTFGVRFSRRSDVPSMFFRATRDLEFTMKQRIESLELGPDWHRIELDFTAGGVTAHLDGREVGRLPLPAVTTQIVGLRSGLRPVELDDVSVTDASGSAIVRESFANRRGSLWIMMRTLASLGFGLLAFLAARRRVLPGGSRREELFAVIIVEAALLILGLSFFAFDYLVWSGRYPYASGTPQGSAASLNEVRYEAMRGRVFGTNLQRDLALARAQAMHANPLLRQSVSRRDPNDAAPPGLFRVFGPEPGAWRAWFHPSLEEFPAKREGTIRVGFLGSSQTFGLGAETVDDTFVARIQRLLSADLPAGSALECLAFASPGWRSADLLRRYREAWGHSDPDILVVNLSNNDMDPEELASNLRQLVEFNRTRGIRTRLVLEPNAREADVITLLEKHAAVRGVAKEFDVPVWDLHAYLNRDDVFDSGFVWWDHVHLTSYGHRLVAQWLAVHLRQ